MLSELKRFGLTAVFLMTLVACQEQLAPISEITKFRVLGIQANPPEIAPGAGTTLRVLYADPKGNGREVTFLWLTCKGTLSIDADLSSGCQPIWVPQFGSSSTGGDIYDILTTPPDILDDLPKEKSFLSVTAILVLCAGGEIALPDTSYPEGQVDALDGLCAQSPTVPGPPEGLVAIKEFRISTSAEPNQNPRIARLAHVESDPAPRGLGSQVLEHMSTRDAGTPEPDSQYVCTDADGCREGAKIEADLTEDSFQYYDKTVFDEVTQVREDPYISWFVAGISPTDKTGRFSDDRTRTRTPPGPFKVDWVPPRRGGLFQLWAVAHDERGGLSWQSYVIEATVPD
ncbi:MAG: hypothetical protein QNJ97_14430 [Myxococcota bacterium]|nr:hypothetical protein [Myxococcota bacterium]